jgi:hypothetical protein
MFRAINKNQILGSYLLSVRNICNLNCTKLNSATRFHRCVTKTGSLSITNAALQNRRLGMSFELQRKLFHVSASRQALPPVVLIILRPLSKIMAILFGRTFRKWWRALPPDKKQDLILRLKRNKMALLGELMLATSFEFTISWHYQTNFP